MYRKSLDIFRFIYHSSGQNTHCAAKSFLPYVRLRASPCLLYRALHSSDIVECHAEDHEEEDKLYKIVQIEVRGSEPAVLKSYEWFATNAAKQLGITVARTWQPKKIHDRYTLLKSVFIYRKHLVQYEIRTHFRIIELKYLTGSTTDTYLEYVQRNLPEGVAMKVTKHAIEKIPDHITPPTQEETKML